MSRIGKLAIQLDEKTTATVGADNTVTVKGPKESMNVKVGPSIEVKVEGKVVTLHRKDDSKETRSLHGLYRALLFNAATGVSKGFNKSLELHGVGYRASVSGKNLELSLGFSHPIVFPIPTGIDIKVDKQTAISITGANRELVGQVAAKIRDFRPPEPYLGKGVRYLGENIRRKAGKSAGK
ncbi:MAG: 50S ribosomal protein L6 [Bdellovibrionota bacterium]